MKTCARCKTETPFYSLRNGICASCAVAERYSEREAIELSRLDATQGRSEAQLAASTLLLTTETAHNLPVTERLDIVSAEVVIGMHLLKDIAAAVRDTFGGRSNVTQNGLRDARRMALNELRMEAAELGADAVVGVTLTCSEIGGQGKAMLMVMATGTAVKLSQPSSTTH